MLRKNVLDDLRCGCGWFHVQNVGFLDHLLHSGLILKQLVHGSAFCPTLPGLRVPNEVPVEIGMPAIWTGNRNYFLHIVVGSGYFITRTIRSPSK
jgi:hypothetical protein